jgi:hypothetical protein
MNTTAISGGDLDIPADIAASVSDVPTIADHARG